MRRGDRLHGGGTGRLVAETLVHVGHVVVDRFRDSDHRQLVTAPQSLLSEVASATLRAIASDDEQNVDLPLDQLFHHAPDVLRAPGGAESGATKAMNIRDIGWRQIDEPVPVVRNQAFKTIRDAKGARNSVAMVGLHDDGTNDVVKPRAESSAGNDGANRLLGLKKNLRARAGRLEAKGLLSIMECFPNGRQIVIQKDARVVSVEGVFFPHLSEVGIERRVDG